MGEREESCVHTVAEYRCDFGFRVLNMFTLRYCLFINSSDTLFTKAMNEFLFLGELYVY